MKKLLCAMALFLAFQPDLFAAPPHHSHTTVTKRTVVVHRPGHTVRKRVVVVHTRPRVVHRHGLVRCRDGVLRRARPGACAGHGGRR